MMKLIRWIFGLCAHDDIVQKTAMINSKLEHLRELGLTPGKYYPDDGNRKIVMTLKCNKCKRLKIKTINV